MFFCCCFLVNHVSWQTVSLETQEMVLGMLSFLLLLIWTAFTVSYACKRVNTGWVTLHLHCYACSTFVNSGSQCEGSHLLILHSSTESSSPLGFPVATVEYKQSPGSSFCKHISQPPFSAHPSNLLEPLSKLPPWLFSS